MSLRLFNNLFLIFLISGLICLSESNVISSKSSSNTEFAHAKQEVDSFEIGAGDPMLKSTRGGVGFVAGDHEKHHRVVRSSCKICSGI